MKPYLTRQQVAEHYPVSVSELAQLASKGRGPRYYKPTNKVLYLPEDIEAWIERHVVEPIDAEVPPRAEPAKRQPKDVIKPKRAPRSRNVLPPAVTPAAPAKRGRPCKNLSPSADSALFDADLFGSAK